MLNEQNQFQTAATNSNGTSTHETGTVTFTGNPFEDLAAYGVELHGYTIRHYRGKNKNGHTITGRFNICGRETTVGATDYESLIFFLVENHREYKAYVRQCHERKRERYRKLRILRQPDYTFYNCNVTVM